MQFKGMFRNSWTYLVNTKRMKNKKNIKINNSEESVLPCGHQYRTPQSVSLIKVYNIKKSTP